MVATSDGSTLHLACHSDAGDVLVDLIPSPDGFRRLDGQVFLTDDLGGLSLEADLTGPGFADSVSGDRLGRFSFRRVPNEVDQLVVHANDVDIKLAWNSK
jgi:hypothetical protein